MKNIFKLFFATLLSSLVSAMAFAVNTDDPNLNQNSGGNALVSGAVMPGINPCEPTKECTGSFQSGPRIDPSRHDHLMPGGSSTNQDETKSAPGTQ